MWIYLWILVDCLPLSKWISKYWYTTCHVVAWCLEQGVLGNREIPIRLRHPEITLIFPRHHSEHACLLTSLLTCYGTNKFAQDAASLPVFLTCYLLFITHISNFLSKILSMLDQKPLEFFLLASVGFRWTPYSPTCVLFCLWLVIKTACLQEKALSEQSFLVYNYHSVSHCKVDEGCQGGSLMKI